MANIKYWYCLVKDYPTMNQLVYVAVAETLAAVEFDKTNGPMTLVKCRKDKEGKYLAVEVMRSRE